MLNFEWFDNFIPYFKFAQKNLNNNNLFFVGWIVRDVLLNLRVSDFQDVDITLAWDPKWVYEKLNQDAWSIFKTDKFGTITIVDKSKKCQYEITPFREEWIYSDVRHPDELTWTNSMLADSVRRDFTMNCLYYNYLEWEKWYSVSFSEEKVNPILENKEKFVKQLKSKWFFLVNEHTLIIQDNLLIQKIIKDGIIKKEEIVKLVGKFDYLHLIFDPQFWINDILNQKIRAVWVADNRINEDALRIIRWIRFVSVLNTHENINFDFETKTWLAMKKYYFLIRKVANERVIQEMKKVFKKWNAFGFVALMDELNILQYYFPALKNCKNNNQPTRYHPFDTYAHTILCLYHLQQINSNYLVRFAMLYHDVGKPDQYYWASIKKDEESQSELYKLEINHPVIWEEITKIDFKKLWFSKKEVEEISFYVRYHMYPGELMFMSEKKKVREIKKFISTYGVERLLNLCDITIWDRLGQYNPLQHSNIQWVFDLKEEINRIYKETWRITLKELNISWNDILKLWCVGPKIWEILAELLDFVIEDESRNEEHILLQKAEQLFKNK